MASNGVGMNIFITGANRGIGLGLELKELQNKSGSPVKLIQIDVQNDVSIISAVAQVDKVISATGGGLNVLINNSGILDKSGGIGATHPDRQVYARHFDVNATGVAMTTAAFLPLIRRANVAGQAAKIINVSSQLGSTANLKSSGAIFGGNIIYGMSKAALNHFTTGLSVEVKDTNIVTIALCPGWVRTDMGGDTATLSVEESASAIAKLISALKKEHSGMYLDRFGNPINY
ncbi:short chain dehydrogenase domain-containing protein [Ditylenchus destructor]|uniref:Short chain dehydrogenase domain-containing protein n=1 Tax=Ditylenchus destructor TaxID=166010 RepID=A0AAD4R7A4_9BILA|nr:short chain dehydrogenase domain-containing protein [Ditylenchus destructor]